MKKIYLWSTLAIVAVFYSCSEDGQDINVPEKDQDISVALLQSVQTPYQHIFNPTKASGGRIMDDGVKSEIMDKVKEVFPQSVFIDDIDDEVERGIPVWEVEIELPNGGDIDFYISKDLLEVVKIDGDDDAYGVEVNPGGDFIALSQAVNAAKVAYEGEIEEWELELDDASRWRYEFEYDDDDVEVYVDAFTGGIIAVYLDDEDDDDDDNDDDDD